MADQNDLNDDAITEVASRFRALGDGVRLRILYLLRDGERAVGELAEATGYSQPNISRHLAQLHRAGMLARRREGNQVFHSVVDPIVFEICSTLCDRIKEDLEGKRDKIG